MSKPKFDRSQFKATKVSALKEQSESVEQATDRLSGNRVKIIELKKDGTRNKLRIYPKHPGTMSYCYPKTDHFLKVKQVDKDGDPIKDEQGNEWEVDTVTGELQRRIE